MLNSTAHWQPLVNGYSDHIPADFRKTVVPLSSFPVARVVRHSRAGRRAIRRLSPRHVQHAAARAALRTVERPTRRICGPSRKKARCGSTKSSTGPTSAVRGVGDAAHVAAGDAIRRIFRGSTTTTPRSTPGWWRGSRISCRAIRLHLFDAPIFFPAPDALAFSEHMVVPARHGRAAPVGRRCRRCWSTTCSSGSASRSPASRWRVLLERWTGSAAAGIVAGCLYSFNAHLLTRFAHLQALHLEFFPIALAAFDRLLMRRAARASPLLLRAHVRAAGAVLELHDGVHLDRPRRRAARAARAVAIDQPADVGPA